MGTATLVVVLSVFNGLEDLLRSLYNTFDPELKVMPVSGKSFTLEEAKLEELKKVEGLSIITEVIEDNALVRYRESQMVVRVKGVSDNFLEQKRLDRALVAGRLMLRDDDLRYAIIGRGVQYTLSISLKDDFHALQFYTPQAVKPGTLDPGKLFTQKNIMPGGVFAIEKQYDNNYIFVPLDFAQELFDYDAKRTALEIKLASGANTTRVQQQLAAVLGERFEVLNSDQQHAELYKLLGIEKLFVFLTFSFILAIASFNIFFSLSMLAIDKRPDVAILNALGADQALIKKIFLAEGAIIALSGALIGLGLGLVICVLQQEYGLVSMGMTTSILEAYPVKIKPTDFLYTGLLIFVITFLASYRPAVLAAKSLSLRYLQ